MYIICPDFLALAAFLGAVANVGELCRIHALDLVSFCISILRAGLGRAGRKDVSVGSLVV